MRIDNEASANATVVEVGRPTASASCTGSPGRSPSSASTSATPQVQTLGPDVVDPSTCATGEGKVTDAYHLAEIERALLHASEPGPG